MRKWSIWRTIWLSLFIVFCSLEAVYQANNAYMWHKTSQLYKEFEPQLEVPSVARFNLFDIYYYCKQPLDNCLERRLREGVAPASNLSTAQNDCSDVNGRYCPVYKEMKFSTKCETLERYGIFRKMISFCFIFNESSTSEMIVTYETILPIWRRPFFIIGSLLFGMPDWTHERICYGRYHKAFKPELMREECYVTKIGVRHG